MNDYWSDGSTSDGDDCSTFSSSSESSPDPFEYLGVPADSDFTSSEHSSGSASDSELGGAFTSSEHSSGSASDCDLDLFDTPFAEWNDDNLCLDLTVSSNLSPIIDTAERKLQDAPHSGVFMVAPSKQATGLDTKGYGTNSDLFTHVPNFSTRPSSPRVLSSPRTAAVQAAQLHALAWRGDGNTVLRQTESNPVVAAYPVVDASNRIEYAAASSSFPAKRRVIADEGCVHSEFPAVVSAGRRMER